MQEFNISAGYCRLESVTAKVGNGDTSTTVIPAFHPSRAVNYYPYQVELRILLMYHFIMAFRFLHGESNIPCCGGKILEKCCTERSESDTLEIRILKCLHKSYLYQGRVALPYTGPGFGGETDFEKINGESKIFDMLAALLRLLLKTPHAFDLVGTLNTVALLQDMTSGTDPSAHESPQPLPKQDMAHDHWFCSGDEDPVSETATAVSAIRLNGDHFSAVVSALTNSHNHVSACRLLDGGGGEDRFHNEYLLESLANMGVALELCRAGFV